MSEAKEESYKAVDAFPGGDKVLLQWSTHPAVERPITSIWVSLLLLALVIIVYLLTYSAVFTLAAAVTLCGSLTQFFFKTSFEFTEQLVRVRYVVTRIEKPWSQYRSYYIDKHGVLLSPFVRPSRLENFRGIYIRFAGNRDEVVNTVKGKIHLVQDPE